MFQFSGLAHLSVYYTFSIVGCPIRRSGDLILVCSSPQLIAAYHVLHRLSEPRHPPCALSCFKKFRNCNYYPTTKTSDHHLKNDDINCDRRKKVDSRLTTFLIFPICQRTCYHPGAAPKDNHLFFWVIRL